MALKARVLIPIVLVAAAAVVVAGPWRTRKAPIRYRAAEATRGGLQSRVSATGTLNPVDQVELGTQVSGTIQRINVDFNSRVHAGEILAQIDPSFFRAQRSQAEANLQKAKVSVQDADRTLKRSRELKAQGLVSQAELDQAETAFQSRAADASQAQAQLELAQVNLEHTTIISPINGIVISRNVDVGQTVAASLQAPKLFQIARDLTEMQLEARVDEADIGQVRDGQIVTFTVDSYPEQPFEGRVFQVRAEPIVESGVVSYTVVVRVKNPSQELLPGMTANVTIVTADRGDALRIPNAALRYRPKPESGDRRERGSAMGGPKGGGRDAAERPQDAGAKTVYLLQKSGPPKPLRVRTGITDGTLTEVVEGPLKEGDQLVVGETDPTQKSVAPTTNPLGGGTPRGGPRGMRL